MIDLHSFVAFFHKVKWAELAITHEISRVLGKNIISCSTVGKYVRAFVLSTKETNTAIVLESETSFSLDARISLVLSEEPFLSVCQIAKKVTLSKSRMYYHLTQTIKWKLHHFQWVPHSLTLTNAPAGKSHKTFGASTVNQPPRVTIICHLWGVMVLLGDRLERREFFHRWGSRWWHLWVGRSGSFWNNL
jgi:hypothetical protein